MATSVLTQSLFTLILLASISQCICWDQDDLELFDLVEEVNANFYEFFGIEQTATTSEVRKAYRKLSLTNHPDKNDAEDATEKFRQIVAIYEVLKDGAKREKYNQVLVEGLPDWRQPVFYYRRAIKMGLYETVGLVILIITIGQYFCAWGVYVERRLALEDALSSVKKKSSNKKKKRQNFVDVDALEEEEVNSIPLPRILGLWPFQLSVWIFYSVYNLPQTIKDSQEEKRLRKEEEEEDERMAVEEAEEAAAIAAEMTRKPKKRGPVELPEYNKEMYASVKSQEGVKDCARDSEVTQLRKGRWTDDDLCMFSKACNKFPGGTPKRWEKIAHMIGRTVAEVTAKAKETKGGYIANVSNTLQGSTFHAETGGMVVDDIMSIEDAAIRDFEVPESAKESVRKRAKPTKITKPAETTTESTKPSIASEPIAEAIDWTQNQQTIFEWALKTYPRTVEKRWDKVAEHIPGKSREDCVARFKLLAEIIKKKKLETKSS